MNDELWEWCGVSVDVLENVKRNTFSWFGFHTWSEYLRDRGTWWQAQNFLNKIDILFYDVVGRDKSKYHSKIILEITINLFLFFEIYYFFWGGLKGLKPFDFDFDTWSE